jgi:hypothetical protein
MRPKQTVNVLREPYWSLQKGESAQAFQAFVIYRDCEDEKPPVKRSKQMVAARLSKSSTLIKRWAKFWRWDERVSYYERYKDSEGPSRLGRKFLRFLDSYYYVYKQLGKERATQEQMAIAWSLEDPSSLRKKIRQNSVPGLNLNHTMLIGYCRFRKWIEDHPLVDPSLAEIEFTVRELLDYLWFFICLERICLGLALEPSAEGQANLQLSKKCV